MSKVILVEFRGEDKGAIKTAQSVETAVKQVGVASTQLTKTSAATAATVTSSTQKVKQDITSMATTIGNNTKITGKNLTDLGSSFRYLSLVSGIASVAAMNAMKSFVTAAASVQDAQLKLGIVATSYGQSMDRTNDAVKRIVSQGLIPMSDAAESMSNLLKAGLNIDTAEKLMNGFIDSIVAGKEVITDTYGKALVKGTLGVLTHNERNIDAIGINTLLNQVYKDYAKSINTVVTSLSFEQKTQAIVLKYMKETSRFAGAAELATMTLTGATNKLSSSWMLAKAAIGSALIPVIATFASVLGVVSNKVEQAASKFPELTMFTTMSVTILVTLTTVLAGLGAILPMIKVGILGIETALKSWGIVTTLTAGKLYLVAAALTLVLYGVLKLTGQWDKWINSTKNLAAKIAETINPMKKQTDTMSEQDARLAKNIRNIKEQMILTTRDFKEGMAEWVKDHDEAIGDIKTKIERLAVDYAKATAKIKGKYADTMTDLTLAHTRKTEDIQREIAEEVSKGIWADQTRIRELQLSLKRENEDYALSTKEKAKTRDENLNEEMTGYSEKLLDLKKELEKEVKLYTDNSEAIRQARLTPLLDEIKERQRGYDERMKQLQRELTEIGGVSAAVVSANDAITASNANVAESYQKVTNTTTSSMLPAIQNVIGASLALSVGLKALNLMKFTSLTAAVGELGAGLSLIVSGAFFTPVFWVGVAAIAGIQILRIKESIDGLQKENDDTIASFDAWGDAINQSAANLSKAHRDGTITEEQFIKGVETLRLRWQEYNEEMEKSPVYAKAWYDDIAYYWTQTVGWIVDATKKAAIFMLTLNPKTPPTFTAAEQQKSIESITNPAASLLNPVPKVTTNSLTPFSNLVSSLQTAKPTGGSILANTNTFTAPSTTYPKTSLEPGMSGSAVKQLQEYLISKNFLAAGGNTGYYGTLTTAAVAALQQKYGVSTGQYAGYWGSATMNKLPQYALGGIIPGSPSTPVPIMAHGGETVLPAGVAPITVNINNPSVRSDADIFALAKMVKDVLSRETKLRQFT